MRSIFLLSIGLLIACGSNQADTDPEAEKANEAKQTISAEKDAQKIEGKDPLANCGADLKELDKWVKSMVAKRNKGTPVDMAKGNELVQKIMAANAKKPMSSECAKVFAEKQKSMSTESADKQKAIEDCQVKCDSITIPPDKIKCQTACK